VDECELETHNCSAQATCENKEGGFACNCNSGYSGNGYTCQGKSQLLLPSLLLKRRMNKKQIDINECTGQGSENNCHTHATCKNTQGSYTCECNDGYDGTGFTCNGNANYF